MGAFMLTWATLSVVVEDSFYGSWAPAYFAIGALLVLVAIGIRFVQWRRQQKSLHVPVLKRTAATATTVPGRASPLRRNFLSTQPLRSLFDDHFERN